MARRCISGDTPQRRVPYHGAYPTRTCILCVPCPRHRRENNILRRLSARVSAQHDVLHIQNAGIVIVPDLLPTAP